MDKAWPGLRQAVIEKSWSGGAFGEILADGEIVLADRVRWAVTFLNQIMQLNLSPDDVNALEQRTEGTEAVKHALAAGDSLGGGRLVEQVILPMLTSGEVTTVIGWLDALPVALRQ
jgi:hypothetical protein